MDKQLVAKWESKGGKYHLELFRDDSGYSYRGDDCGGFMGQVSELDAYRRMMTEYTTWPSRAYRIA